jgi:hypothetical protein
MNRNISLSLDVTIQERCPHYVLNIHDNLSQYFVTCRLANNKHQINNMAENQKKNNTKKKHTRTKPKNINVQWRKNILKTPKE